MVVQVVDKILGDSDYHEEVWLITGKKKENNTSSFNRYWNGALIWINFHILFRMIKLEIRF